MTAVTFFHWQKHTAAWFDRALSGCRRFISNTLPLDYDSVESQAHGTPLLTSTRAQQHRHPHPHVLQWQMTVVKACQKEPFKLTRRTWGRSWSRARGRKPQRLCLLWDLCSREGKRCVTALISCSCSVIYKADPISKQCQAGWRGCVKTWEVRSCSQCIRIGLIY